MRPVGIAGSPRLRWRWMVGGSGVLLVLALMLAPLVGSTSLTPSRVLAGLGSWDSSTDATIFFRLRLPRVLLAAIVALVFNFGFMQAPGLLHPMLGDSHNEEVIRTLTNVGEHLKGWFGRGQIDTSLVVFYLGGMAFFLFLTVRSVESRKWR